MSVCRDWDTRSRTRVCSGSGARGTEGVAPRHRRRFSQWSLLRRPPELLHWIPRPQRPTSGGPHASAYGQYLIDLEHWRSAVETRKLERILDWWRECAIRHRTTGGGSSSSRSGGGGNRVLLRVQPDPEWLHDHTLRFTWMAALVRAWGLATSEDSDMEMEEFGVWALFHNCVGRLLEHAALGAASNDDDQQHLVRPDPERPLQAVDRVRRCLGDTIVDAEHFAGVRAWLLGGGRASLLSCPVCLRDAVEEDGTPWWVGTCGHILCSACAIRCITERWSHPMMSCPVCRVVTTAKEMNEPGCVLLGPPRRGRGGGIPPKVLCVQQHLHEATVPWRMAIVVTQHRSALTPWLEHLRGAKRGWRITHGPRVALLGGRRSTDHHHVHLAWAPELAARDMRDVHKIYILDEGDHTANLLETITENGFHGTVYLVRHRGTLEEHCLLYVNGQTSPSERLRDLAMWFVATEEQ